jgi:ribosomal protein S18 acetylase RimI-like enzyme
VKYLWLEVSNVNGPAIRCYSKMGFRVCGLDVSLYEGTGSRGEVGVFMWRRFG